jgi:hypothetical protein
MLGRLLSDHVDGSQTMRLGALCDDGQPVSRGNNKRSLGCLRALFIPNATF